MECLDAQHLGRQGRPVAAEEVKVPGQEVGGLAPAHGIVAKVILHVGDQLPVHANPVLGCQAQLAALLDLLENPWLDQRPPPRHQRQKAAIPHPFPGLLAYYPVSCRAMAHWVLEMSARTAKRWLPVRMQ